MIGIYKVTNNITGKVYIGQSKDIESRWDSHIKTGPKNYEKFKKNKFYNAIKEYGIENFSFEIIEETSEELLDERERYWIEYYNSYYDGYNGTKGGQGHESKIFSAEEIQLLWDKGNSITEIADQMNCSISTVKRRLIHYEKYSQEEGRKRSHDYGDGSSLGKIVYQYDLNGNFLNRFESIKEAARSLGDESKNICIREAMKSSTGYSQGYLWRDFYSQSIPPYENSKICNTNKFPTKKIRCIETNTIFNSIKEATEWCNLKHHQSISANLTGKRKSAGKLPGTNIPLHWEYIT